MREYELEDVDVNNLKVIPGDRNSLLAALGGTAGLFENSLRMQAYCTMDDEGNVFAPMVDGKSITKVEPDRIGRYNPIEKYAKVLEQNGVVRFAEHQTGNDARLYRLETTDGQDLALRISSRFEERLPLPMVFQSMARLDNYAEVMAFGSVVGHTGFTLLYGQKPGGSSLGVVYGDGLTDFFAVMQKQMKQSGIKLHRPTDCFILPDGTPVWVDPGNVTSEKPIREEEGKEIGYRIQNRMKAYGYEFEWIKPDGSLKQHDFYPKTFGKFSPA